MGGYSTLFHYQTLFQKHRYIIGMIFPGLVEVGLEI